MANSGDLYTRDETAWLDVMARLIAERRFGELDYEHLHEFLTDMARRDRREVLSRLTTLLYAPPEVQASAGPQVE